MASQALALPQAHDDLKRQIKALILKEASDAQIELAIRVCDRYGFDPLLKHVVFISNNLYVTRDGLLDNAHRSERFDGIEVEAERDSEGFWVATAKVWRKDMARPFVYSAYEPEHFVATSSAWKKSPRAMTVKCAEVMALRRAFNISLGAAEEMGFDDEEQPPLRAIPAPPQRPAAPPASSLPQTRNKMRVNVMPTDSFGPDAESGLPPALPKLWAIAQRYYGGRDKADAALHEWIKVGYPDALRDGKPSIRALTAEQVQEIIDAIEAAPEEAEVIEEVQA